MRLNNFTNASPLTEPDGPGRAAALVLFILGTLVLANPAWYIQKISGGRAAPPAYDAFAYDQDFLRLRGPILLGLICIALALQVALLVQGRWQPMTRRADLVLNLVICAALTWILAAGPIFQAAPTDQALKGAIALIILFTLIDVGWRARRHQVQQDGQV